MFFVLILNVYVLILNVCINIECLCFITLQSKSTVTEAKKTRTTSRRWRVPGPRWRGESKTPETTAASAETVLTTLLVQWVADHSLEALHTSTADTNTSERSDSHFTLGASHKGRPKNFAHIWPPLPLSYINYQSFFDEFSAILSSKLPNCELD